MGKYGTRYGASLRKQMKKVEVSQHAKYTCAFCGKVDLPPPPFLPCPLHRHPAPPALHYLSLRGGSLLLLVLYRLNLHVFFLSCVVMFIFMYPCICMLSLSFIVFVMLETKSVSNFNLAKLFDVVCVEACSAAS